MQNPFEKAHQLHAMFFFHMAAEYLRTFGKEGEAVLRKEIGALGRDLGKTYRKDHERCNYPIHLKTLFAISAFPGEKANFKCNIIDDLPHKRTYETSECPLYDHWKLVGGLEEGRIYCEEMQRSIWSAYDESISTNQPKVKTRGDDVCRFEILMPKAENVPETEELEEISCEEQLRHLMDIMAKMHYYLGRGLYGFGLEGDAALRRAIRIFGYERGVNIRRDHLSRGLEINVKNLFTHYDLYAHNDPRIKKNQIEFTEESRRNESLNCTMYDIWKTYPDGIEIGKIYCEEVHHQIYGGYDNAIQINLTQTLTRGDDRCRFATFGRPANKVSPPDWAKKYKEQLHKRIGIAQ